MHDERVPLSTVKTSIRNRRKKPVTLRLEPWGEEYAFPPGTSVQVLGRGPVGDMLDVKWGGDAVTVFGWPGSVLQVMKRGVDLGAKPGQKEKERLTAPFLPDGYRMQEWVGAMRSGKV